MSAAGAFGVAAVVTVVALAVLLPLLRRFAVDVPNHRSSHSAPTPRGGGLGVLAGIFSSVVVGGVLADRSMWAVLGGVALVALVGLADDLADPPVLLRLLGTLVGCATMVLGATGPGSWGGYATALVLVVAAGGYTNAFNFMDGINAISSLSAAVAGGWFAFVAHRSGASEVMVLGTAVCGASLAFLPFNAPRARVFMGDSGSYGLGAALAALAVLVWSSGADPLVAVAPLVLYVADTFSAFVRRVTRGDSWSEAHREHVYQQLVDGGRSHLGVAVLVALTSAAMCAFAWATRGLPPVVGVAGLCVVTAAYLTLPWTTGVRETRRGAARGEPA